MCCSATCFRDWCFSSKTWTRNNKITFHSLHTSSLETKDDGYVFWRGFIRRYTLTRTVWLTLNALQASSTVKKSSFQDTSHRQILPSCHNTCQRLWHSITPSMPAITRVSSRGTAGRATAPLIGWMAAVRRAGVRRWARVTEIMTMLQHGSSFW